MEIKDFVLKIRVPVVYMKTQKHTKKSLNIINYSNSIILQSFFSESFQKDKQPVSELLSLRTEPDLC